MKKPLAEDYGIAGVYLEDLAEYYNQLYFNGELDINIEFSDMSKFKSGIEADTASIPAGEYVLDDNVVYISNKYIKVTRNGFSVLKPKDMETTLVHELCHQAAFKISMVFDEPPHGETWVRWMKHCKLKVPVYANISHANMKVDELVMVYTEDEGNHVRYLAPAIIVEVSGGKANIKFLAKNKSGEYVKKGSKYVTEKTVNNGLLKEQLFKPNKEQQKFGNVEVARRYNMLQEIAKKADARLKGEQPKFRGIQALDIYYGRLPSEIKGYKLGEPGITKDVEVLNIVYGNKAQFLADFKSEYSQLKGEQIEQLLFGGEMQLTVGGLRFQPTVNGELFLKIVCSINKARAIVVWLHNAISPEITKVDSSIDKYNEAINIMFEGLNETYKSSRKKLDTSLLELNFKQIGE